MVCRPNAVVLKVLLLAGLAAIPGCAWFREQGEAEYVTAPPSKNRDSKRASDLNFKGAHHLDLGDFEEAERRFKSALVKDVDFGPAHNNLGKVYFGTGRLYLAAWEFEMAHRLMPERIEPPLNLAMVYETAGRYNRAREMYEQLYAQYPQDAIVIGNLARTLMQLDADQELTVHLLRELIFYDTRPDWIAWAKEMLATKYRRFPAAEYFEESIILPVDPDGTGTTAEELPTPHLPTPQRAPALDVAPEVLEELMSPSELGMPDEAGDSSSSYLAPEFRRTSASHSGSPATEDLLTIAKQPRTLSPPLISNPPDSKSQGMPADVARPASPNRSELRKFRE